MATAVGLCAATYTCTNHKALSTRLVTLSWPAGYSGTYSCINQDNALHSE